MPALTEAQVATWVEDFMDAMQSPPDWKRLGLGLGVGGGAGTGRRACGGAVGSVGSAGSVRHVRITTSG